MLKGEKIWIFLVFIICFSPLALAEVNVITQIEKQEKAESIVENILNEQLSNLSYENIEKEVKELNREIDQSISTLNFSKMVREFIKGEFKFDWKRVFNSILTTIFREVMANSKLLGQLFVLAVISAILKTFQDAFAGSEIAKITNGMIYLVLVLLALNSFMVASKIGIDAIDAMVEFMQALLPTIFTLLISMGAVGSATIFQPFIFLVVSVISTVIKTVVLPFISFAVILSVVSNFTGEFKLSRLGGFFKEIAITILGLSFVIFFGVMLIQGVGVSVADGISLRTAKYLTGAFVPIVGGMFADALELVVGCSLLIQNAIGLIGMLIIFLTVIFPVVKILAIVFIYKFVSAIIQPIGEQMIVDCLNNLGNALLLIFLAVTTVSIMYFMVITIVVGISNVTVMLR